jgi:hypothetical protein
VAKFAKPRLVAEKPATVSDDGRSVLVKLQTCRARRTRPRRRSDGQLSANAGRSYRATPEKCCSARSATGFGRNEIFEAFRRTFKSGVFFPLLADHTRAILLLSFRRRSSPPACRSLGATGG